MSDGRWITIGGVKGEDGKRHGGSPVYVENGRITKGSPHLTGKRIDALGEKAEGGTVRQANKQEADYGRASWAKKARAEGLDPKHLHHLAADLLAHDKANTVDLRDMLTHVVTTHPWVRGVIVNARHGIDQHSVKTPAGEMGLDQISQELAHNPRYGHLFHSDRGDVAEDNSEKLFDYLIAGKPQAMPEADAYEQAFDHLMGEKRRGVPQGDVDDSVPFSRTREPNRYDAAFEATVERNPDGTFAEQAFASKSDVTGTRKQLAAGKIAVKTGDAVSAATGRPIKRYVELANGAKIHPDELHRIKFDEHGEPFVSIDEGLTVNGRRAKSFALAVAHASMSKGPATISGAHGYSVTLPGSEWRKIPAKGTFSEWHDEQDQADLAKRREAPAEPSTTIGSEKDTDDFFAGRDAGQGRLFAKPGEPETPIPPKPSVSALVAPHLSAHDVALAHGHIKPNMPELLDAVEGGMLPLHHLKPNLRHDNVPVVGAMKWKTKPTLTPDSDKMLGDIGHQAETNIKSGSFSIMPWRKFSKGNLANRDDWDRNVDIDMLDNPHVLIHHDIGPREHWGMYNNVEAAQENAAKVPGYLQPRVQEYTDKYGHDGWSVTRLEPIDRFHAMHDDPEVLKHHAYRLVDHWARPSHEDRETDYARRVEPTRYSTRVFIDGEPELYDVPNS